LVVAVFALPSAASAQICPNEALRTGPSANLPDCRAYEQVTPPFKEGALPSFGTGVIKGLGRIAGDGSRVDVVSAGDFGQPNSTKNNLIGASYELTRTESGWSEENIDLPASQFPADLALDATPDLGETLFEARATFQPLDAMDLLIRAADGSLRDLGPVFPPSSTTEPPGLGDGSVGYTTGSVTGASEDLSHVLFEIEGPSAGRQSAPVFLWPGDTTAPVGTSHIGENRFSLYEYVAGQGGPPALVSVDSEGQISQCGIGHEGSEAAISADGSRVFFTVNPGGCESGASGPPVKELFARTDESQTVAISEPSPADCSACDTSPGVLAEARFAAASADGSKVVFTTSQPLLGADASANIYEYDFDFENPAGQKLVQVSGGAWGAGGAQVQNVSQSNSTGVVKVSPDGSHVYFVAKGALSGAVNSQEQHPTEGEDNLYVFERDAQFPGGRLSFIATLSPSDLEIMEGGCGGQACGATVTPDGRFLAFTSSADLTPGDTSTARQVFEYDAQTGELARVSIGQDGFNENGNTDTFNAEIPSGLAMSEDGAYVVFQSADGLTPQALNGRLEEFETEQAGVKERLSYYANNVYEYHDGNVYLISDGRDATSSTQAQSSVQVDGLSASGKDIFFETADRLVPQDTDTQLDVYDARIDGGFPAPVSLLPNCSGDACQEPLSASPVLLSPGSQFQAGGNPPLAAATPTTKPKAKPAKCKKGYVKKKGKCVKKPKAKKKAKAKKAGDKRRARS
jgi:Tol biopolymer transport system component